MAAPLLRYRKFSPSHENFLLCRMIFDAYLDMPGHFASLSFIHKSRLVTAFHISHFKPACSKLKYKRTFSPAK